MLPSRYLALRAKLRLNRMRSLFQVAVASTVLLALAWEAAAAVTLHHTYSFDSRSLRLSHGQLGLTLHAGDLPRTWEQDRAELPYDIVNLLVPQGARLVRLRAQGSGEWTFATGIELAHARPLVAGDGHAMDPKPARRSNSAAKGMSTESYPSVAAELAGVGRLHGYQFVSLKVYPVLYESGPGRILVTPHMELELELEMDSSEPVQRERYSASIEWTAQQTLADLVDNPEALTNYRRRIGAFIESSQRGFHPTDAPSLEGSPVQYVIVTSQALEASFQVLADWKTRRGIPTVVRTTEWIEANYRRGSDLQETIRNFIKDAYAKWGVEYVLLGADTEVLPARYGFSDFGLESEQDIPTDMYFACLDGSWNLDGDELWGEAALDSENPVDDSDLYAEVFVGRLPVTTSNEANALIAKIMQYENPVSTSYQDEVLLLGEVLFPVDWEPNDPVIMDAAEFSDSLATFANPGADVTKLYQNLAGHPDALPLSVTSTIAEMNLGYGLVNHIGHGFRSNMSVGDLSLVVSDALALTNSEHFVLYLLNCTATAFDFPCLAEAFLESSGGAVAVLGSSRAAYPLPAYNYNLEFFRNLYTDDVTNVGKLFVNSRLPMTPLAWLDTADHYMHFLYNMLADPEMPIHTRELGLTAVSHPTSLGLGSHDVSIHVSVGGVPRQGALICLQKGNEEYVSGTTDANGDVVLQFVAESAGSAYVTVSGANMTTYLGSITISAGGLAYVHTQSLTLDDDGLGGSSGNADGTLDAGETLQLSVTFKNDGTVTAANVGGVFRCVSPWVSVLDSLYTLGSIAPGASASTSGPLRFRVDPNTPDGTVLSFQFACTDGDSTWTDVVNKVVHAPIIELTHCRIDDAEPGGNGDGVIQAGETIDVHVTLKNYGTGAVDGLIANITTSDPDLVISNGMSSVGRIEHLQEVTPGPPFRLTENVIEENVIFLALSDGYGRASIRQITLRGPGQPAPPVLDATLGAGVIIAIWTPSVDADLAGYHVYRALGDTLSGWTRVTADRIGSSYFRDTSLLPSTKYFYYVTAVDSSGNESVPSTLASINTQPAQLAGWPIPMATNTTCTPAVGDITGDGSKEIVAGNLKLYAWDWQGIELLDDDNDPQTWGVFANEINSVTAAVVLADFDPSPGYEVFAGVWNDANRAYIVRGDGSFVDGWPQNPTSTVNPPGYWSSPAAIDLDGDGVPEVMASSKNGSLYAWHADGTPVGATVEFKSNMGVWTRSTPTFANLDTDPYPEIVYASLNGVLYVWEADGSDLPHFPISVARWCKSSTAIGDLNNDGIQDIVMITEGGAVNVFESSTGTQLPGWPVTLSIEGGLATSPSPALGDFDFDGYLEIVIANNGNPANLSAVRIFDYQGNLLPGWPREVGGKTSESSPVIVDVSGDGSPDVLFGNEDGRIFGWDKDGNELVGFPLTTGDFVRATPFADDVDGDGDVDLVLPSWEGNLWIWDFTAPYVEAAAQWPTLKHDTQRTGFYHFRARTPTDVDEDEEIENQRVPARLHLAQNVPNPFNPVTSIDYGVPVTTASTQPVQLDIFDANGRRVRTLVRGSQGPGSYKALWDGRDDAGRRVHSGVYFYRLTVAGESLTRKMLLLK